MRRRLAGVAAGTAALLVLAACGSDDADDTAEPAAGGLTPVKLQLQWFTQAQFAGYFAAVDQGFYNDVGLDVDILEGGVDIVPATVLAEGDADFAISWVPKVLGAIEQGTPITNIGQIFQKSGTWQVSFADAGIDSPADLAGKKVGNWGYGNELELFAGLTDAGVDLAGVEHVQQQFDMQALLAGDIDSAQAMSYNEYAQVLEAVNPDTGELYKPEDFSVIDWNDVGTAMLQDAVWASSERLESDPAYEQTATKFLEASMKGWIYCRDNPESCRDIVVAAGSQLGASHQLWQMNEINKLVWPSSAGIGVLDETAWDRTVEIAKSTQQVDETFVITEDPPTTAYSTEYAQTAVDNLKAEGLDVTGEGFEPIEVTLNEGGE